jgi:hypothetical protein
MTQQPSPSSGGYVYISRGVNRRYHVLVRPQGHKKYRYVKEFRTLRAAAKCLSDKMASDSFYKRGAVTMSADYYDPICLLEMSRP